MWMHFPWKKKKENYDSFSSYGIYGPFRTLFFSRNMLILTYALLHVSLFLPLWVTFPLHNLVSVHLVFMQFALPHIMGWDWLNNQQHKHREINSMRLDSRALDLEWDKWSYSYHSSAAFRPSKFLPAWRDISIYFLEENCCACLFHILSW